MPDATIIGAGPAGSAVAIFLARRGWSVTIIEQHRFPRDKVCGECLSSLGIDVLTRLDLLPLLEADGAVWLHNAILHGADGRSATTPLPRPMLGISRHKLDLLLLNAAIAAGTIVRQPARCEAIEITDKSACLQIRDLIDNRVQTLTSSFVILADGKSALAGPIPASTGDMGIKTHWENVTGARDAIELFTLHGCYGGLARIEGGRWNTALSVPASRVRAHHGNLDLLFGELLCENVSLQRRLAGARRVGPWLAAPLPRFAVRRDFPTRVIPIGNAAAALEPIGGEGMGLALRSAEIASEMLYSAHDEWNAGHCRALYRHYDQLWRKRRAGCRAAAMVVSSTNGMDVALDWMRENECLTRGAMTLIGKTSAASAKS